jgi:hypothetical protein
VAATIDHRSLAMAANMRTVANAHSGTSSVHCDKIDRAWNERHMT